MRQKPRNACVRHTAWPRTFSVVGVGSLSASPRDRRNSIASALPAWTRTQPRRHVTISNVMRLNVLLSSTNSYSLALRSRPLLILRDDDAECRRYRRKEAEAHPRPHTLGATWQTNEPVAKIAFPFIDCRRIRSSPSLRGRHRSTSLLLES